VTVAIRRRRYSHTTDSIAPVWIAMSNVLADSP
jgi:hypothetical protein